jgi:hypothetical protein
MNDTTPTPPTSTGSTGSFSLRRLPTAAKVGLVCLALGFVIRVRSVTVTNGDCSESEPTAVIFGGAAVVAGLIALAQGVRTRDRGTIVVGAVTVAVGIYLVLKGVGTISTACG